MIYLIKDGDLIITDNRITADTFISEGYIEHSEKDTEVIALSNKLNAVQRIAELKQLLAASDWKVIVNAELLQNGLKLKYPNLHAERQTWRDEINKLE